MSADDMQSIFDQMVLERGGVEKLATADLAIVRAVARLLSDDALDARGASSAAALVALLPPPLPRVPQIAAAEVGTVDLARLEDEELDRLDEIMKRASGLIPAPPYSRRRDYALELAALLDAAVCDLPRPSGYPVDQPWFARGLPPDDEALWVKARGLIDTILYPGPLAAHLYGTAILEAKVRDAERRAADAEQRATMAETKAASRLATDPTHDARSNVVPINRALPLVVG